MLLELDRLLVELDDKLLNEEVLLLLSVLSLDRLLRLVEDELLRLDREEVELLDSVLRELLLEELALLLFSSQKSTNASPLPPL